MADQVYDPDDRPDDNPLTPDDIKEMEDRHAAVDRDVGDYINKTGYRKSLRHERQALAGKDTDAEELRERYTEKEAEEDEKLKARVNDLFKEEPEKSEIRKGNLLGSNKSKKRLGAALAGLGIPGIILGIAFLPNLFAVFKVQNFFENIEISTAARLNAQFENRSDRWFKAYIQLRLTEIDGGAPGNYDNLFFRANRIDTDNPIRDWYNTMRTSRFEADLAKQGIVFTSHVSPEGNIGFSQIRIDRGQNIEINLGQNDDGSPINLNMNDPVAISNFLNGPRGAELDNVIESVTNASGPGSNKEARKLIKEAVDGNTRKWQVFKRRQVRKGIQNMTGVRSWRLFETTRDKIDRKKLSVQRKILQAVLPDNRTGTYIKCMFGAGPCPSTSDPASADAQASSSGSDNSRESADNTETEEFNDDGLGEPEPVDTNGDGTPDTIDNSSTTEYNPGSVSDDLASETGELVGEELAEEGAEEAAGHVIRDFVVKLIGNPYTKMWSWLKKLTAMHNLFSEGKLSGLVTNAKRAQYMTAFTYGNIGLSQLKSGDLVNSELFKYTSVADDPALGFAQTTPDVIDNGQVSEFLGIFENFERSEGWMLYGNGKAGPEVAQALALEDQGRTKYCDMSEADKREQPIHYKCPDDDLGSSNASRLEEMYMNSAGRMIAPIATAVNAVEDSFIGSIFGAVEGIADSVTGPIMEGVMSATGADDLVTSIATTGLVKVMSWSGAGVKYVPGNAGEGNYQLMGGAATAESTARMLGAVSTDSFAGLREYTLAMTEQNQKEKLENMTLYDRYASLSNPRSFASNALMAIGTSSPGDLVEGVANPTGVFNNYAKIFSGNAQAATQSPYAVAEWTGAETFDIPQQCIELEILAPDYYERVTNAPESVPRTPAILGDSDAFWKAVYEALPGEDDAAKEEAAKGIYNCALFDQSILGGFGLVYGYAKDDGLESGAGGTVTGNDPGVNAPGLNGFTFPCTGQPAAVKRLSGDRADWSGVPTSGNIGSNSGNQPINVYIRSACAATNVKTVIIVGSIHGRENGGQLVAWEMLFNATLPSNVRIIAIPELNGTAAAIHARKNKAGTGVDLNRNFPTNWEQGDSDGSHNEASPSDDHYRGPSPGSEPESQAIMNFLTGLGLADLFVIYHDNLNYVAPVRMADANLARAYATAAGMHGKCSDNPQPDSANCAISEVPQHGSLDLWYKTNVGTPSILVELSNDQGATAIQRQVTGLTAAIEALQ